MTFSDLWRGKIGMRNAAIAVVPSLLILACADKGFVAEPDIDIVGVPGVLAIEGLGKVDERYTAELWVHGNTAYTTTWGSRTVGGVKASGNAVKIWDVSGSSPVFVDSLIVSGASTLGDIQVSPDGSLLVVATEFAPGSIVVYGLSDPRKPVQLSRFSNASTAPGVHTAEVQPVNGRLYGFLSIDPGESPARLVIVDLGTPTAPTEVAALQLGNPYQHDVFVRDGILMTAEWHDGMSIWDVGGAGKGGSVSHPVRLGNVRTNGGSVHNVWWFRDSAGLKRYAFVGEEGPGSPSSGDIHVVDVSDFANPREIAFFSVPGAGTHNFWMDEARGLLYAAYYNAGVRVLDVRGNLASCSVEHRSADGRCNLGMMGRERARGLGQADALVARFHEDGDGQGHNVEGSGSAVFVWGVHGSGGRVYASDMQNGLWKLREAQ